MPSSTEISLQLQKRLFGFDLELCQANPRTNFFSFSAQPDKLYCCFERRKREAAEHPDRYDLTLRYGDQTVAFGSIETNSPLTADMMQALFLLVLEKRAADPMIALMKAVICTHLMADRYQQDDQTNIQALCATLQRIKNGAVVGSKSASLKTWQDQYDPSIPRLYENPNHNFELALAAIGLAVLIVCLSGLVGAFIAWCLHFMPLTQAHYLCVGVSAALGLLLATHQVIGGWVGQHLGINSPETFEDFITLSDHQQASLSEDRMYPQIAKFLIAFFNAEDRTVSVSERSSQHGLAGLQAAILSSLGFKTKAMQPPSRYSITFPDNLDPHHPQGFSK